MANQNRKRADQQQHGIRLPATPSSTSSHDSTPSDSSSGSSRANLNYFTLHGIASKPNDDFNSKFNRLSIREGWSKKQRKKQRHEAIAGEIDGIYGIDTTKLEKWQELCRDVRIEPVPGSITKCRKALARVNVNLVNLIDHRRNRNVELKLFANYQAFRAWTLAGEKGSRIFPKNLAKEEGFIKALLKDMCLH